MRAAAIVVIFALAGTGCATVRGVPGPVPDRERLTPQEFSDLPCTNAYEAVQELRPFWLATRGPTGFFPSDKDYPQVFVNGMWQGDLNQLRLIRLEGVREIRFLSIGETQVRFGPGYPSGGIHVQMGGR